MSRRDPRVPSDRAPREGHSVGDWLPARFAQIGIVAIILCAWQFAPATLLDDTLTSRPTQIAAQIFKWLNSGVLQQEAWFTLSAVIAGLLAGGLVGIGGGMLAGTVPALGRLIEPPVKFLFALPKIAFVPLFIVWFGIGLSQETIFTAMVVFFFFFYASFNGARSVPTALSNMLILAGGSRWQRVRLLYLPASVGWLLAGLRLAIPYAFVSAVSAEVISSQHGLGNLVKTSASVMDPAGMFAAMFFLLLVSVSVSGAVLFLGGRSRWSV